MPKRNSTDNNESSKSQRDNEEAQKMIEEFGERTGGEGGRKKAKEFSKKTEGKDDKAVKELIIQSADINDIMLGVMRLAISGNQKEDSNRQKTNKNDNKKRKTNTEGKTSKRQGKKSI